jgi:methylthioribose-1-phosphate isomerase
MAGHLMARGRIACVIVGTDRTAANGDVANKIGTYTHAVVAHRHGIPFYVAAPTSSVDLSCPSGDLIPIEERAAREVTHVFDRQIAPSGVRVLNPAFDVTPAELVTAIITERGVARAPLAKTLPRLVQPAPRETSAAKAAMSRGGRTAASRGDRKQRRR